MKTIIFDNWRLAIRTMIALAIAIYPILFSVWSYHIYGHADIGNIIPVKSDEIDYWLQCRSFHKAGFHSGYFTLDETTPPLSFSPYGWHGPAFPILVGTFAKLWGGITPSAALPFNLAWLTASLVVFLALTRPGLRHLCLLFFFVIGLARLYWYMPSFFQEPYHCGIAFVLAAFFLHLYASKRRLYWFGITFLALFYAAYLRVSWAVFFFPLMISVFPASRKGRIFALAAGFVSLTAVYVLYQYSAAPYSLGVGRNYALNFLLGKSSLLQTIHSFFSLTTDQVQDYLSSFYPDEHTEMLLIILWFFSGSFLLLRKMSADDISSRHNNDTIHVFWLHIFGVGGLIFLEIIYYGLESRVLIPHFILSFVVIMHQVKRSYVLTLFVIIQIAIFPIFFQFFPDRIYPLANNVTERERFVDFGRFIKPLVSYKSNKNKWCNTILFGRVEWPVEIMAFEPGLGTSFITLEQKPLGQDVKSRFVFLANDTQASLIKKSNDFQFIAHTAMGDLYLNNQCQCD
jgi:hypothetical protein